MMWCEKYFDRHVKGNGIWIKVKGDLVIYKKIVRQSVEKMGSMFHACHV